ncbi:MAG TPA: YhcH/YjgK/YiaL family protein [Prolixibacteraceae bacterium]|nr:YhcH/YjgK/YiaL family protein [Prolixibacteraceae bacterium]
MILDKVENVALYTGISPLLDEGLKFISENDFSAIEPGKYFLKDQLLYAMVNEYTTRAAGECKLEAHQKYIDIQFMVAGKEQIGYTSLRDQESSEAYNPEKDVVFFTEKVDLLTLDEGRFAIFFPDDLHQPGIQAPLPEKVRKVVVKVAV